MPKVEGFESTPNPHAVKILLDGRLEAPPRSYREPPSGPCGDALAEALYAIEGVRVVLIHHEFVTIGKASEDKWPTIKRKAKSVIQGYRESEPAAEPGADG